MSDLQLNPFAHRGTIQIPVSDTVLAGTQTLPLGAIGMTTHFILTTPAMEGTDSVLMEINNTNDETFYTSGTKAESSTTTTGSEVILMEGDKIVMTAEGTQSVNVDQVYEIRGHR